MTWQEYQTMQAAANSKTIQNGYWVKTDVKCPECGELIYKNIGRVFPTSPVKYEYECSNCHWGQVGY